MPLPRPSTASTTTSAGCTRPSQPWSNQYLVALRARTLDDWAADFLRRNPNAVVLHLGCGMDTRAFRLDVPAGVDWFDVDQPDVIDLRRNLYEDRDGYRMIGSSVTDADWLEQIPTGRPVLVVGEGLLPYLTERQVWELLERLTDRFGSGELLFDTLSPIAPATVPALYAAASSSGASAMPGRSRRGTRGCGSSSSSSALAGFERIQQAPQRRLFRVLNATPVRNYDVLNRFAF